MQQVSAGAPCFSLNHHAEALGNGYIKVIVMVISQGLLGGCTNLQYVLAILPTQSRLLGSHAVSDSICAACCSCSPLFWQGKIVFIITQPFVLTRKGGYHYYSHSPLLQGGVVVILFTLLNISIGNICCICFLFTSFSLFSHWSNSAIYTIHHCPALMSNFQILVALNPI